MHKIKTATKAIILLAAILALPAAGFSEEGRNVEFSGFVLGQYTGRVTGLEPIRDESGDYALAEERVRIDARGWSESIRAEARVKVDIFHDDIDNEFDVELREGYIDYTMGAFDFRIGRQVVTWGVGDLLFINDVWPKDWVSFFTGRPMEYLKLGVDGFRARFSSNIVNAELIAVPFFTPDNMPTPDRFFYYDPFAAVPMHVEEKPDGTFENTEVGLRIYRRIADFDISLYGYKGFWRTPSATLDNFLMPTVATLFYPELQTYGASAQKSMLGGVISLEGGYYNSTDDDDGTDPLIPNSQIKFLAGYSRQLWKDFTVGAQYYGEIMQEYSNYLDTLPAGFPAKEEYRDIVTLRLEQLFLNQNLKLSAFAFYSPVDDDYLVQPQVSYKFSDQFSGAVGGNIWGGADDYTFLGQFDKNDNAYISARYDF